jgi:hypothetical protein
MPALRSNTILHEAVAHIRLGYIILPLMAIEGESMPEPGLGDRATGFRLPQGFGDEVVRPDEPPAQAAEGETGAARAERAEPGQLPAESTDSSSTGQEAGGAVVPSGTARIEAVSAAADRFRRLAANSARLAEMGSGAAAAVARPEPPSLPREAITPPAVTPAEQRRPATSVPPAQSAAVNGRPPAIRPAAVPRPDKPPERAPAPTQLPALPPAAADRGAPAEMAALPRLPLPIRPAPTSVEPLPEAPPTSGQPLVPLAHQETIASAGSGLLPNRRATPEIAHVASEAPRTATPVTGREGTFRGTPRPSSEAPPPTREPAEVARRTAASPVRPTPKTVEGFIPLSMFQPLPKVTVPVGSTGKTLELTRGIGPFARTEEVPFPRHAVSGPYVRALIAGLEPKLKHDPRAVTHERTSRGDITIQVHSLFPPSKPGEDIRIFLDTTDKRVARAADDVLRQRLADGLAFARCDDETIAAFMAATHTTRYHDPDSKRGRYTAPQNAWLSKNEAVTGPPYADIGRWGTRAGQQELHAGRLSIHMGRIAADLTDPNDRLYNPSLRCRLVSHGGFAVEALHPAVEILMGRLEAFAIPNRHQRSDANAQVDAYAHTLRLIGLADIVGMGEEWADRTIEIIREAYSLRPGAYLEDVLARKASLPEEVDRTLGGIHYIGQRVGHNLGFPIEVATNAVHWVFRRGNYGNQADQGDD